MQEFVFFLQGNPEDEGGNPQPYFRQTRGTKGTPGAQRYHGWQRFVANKFLASLTPRSPAEQAAARAMINYGKPVFLDPGQEAELNLKIYCKDNTHADADNIFKGILDSLFVNDKKVTKGSFELCIHPGAKAERIGWVEVKIKITP